ncbi:MAG: glycosyltransferase family 4 protein [Muribaculum sp.]|nr:glycosyltransferase family 4 protein [Muribaculum sp.]
MNILFSAEDYPTPNLPFTAFVAELCREFTRQGHSVTVIAPQSLTTWLRGKSKLLPKHDIDKIIVGGREKIINIYRPYFLTYKKYNIFKRSALLHIANKLPKPDICYAHFWTSGNRIVRYSQKNQIPLFVATGEDVIVLQDRLSDKELTYLRDNVTGVICVSTKNQQESISKGFTSQEKCVVFPNAIDNKIFYPKNREDVRKELGCAKDDFVVAFVGRFDKRKGVKRVSDAIKSLSDKSIKSIFIGRSSIGESEQPDCDGIIFMGTLAHEDLPNYLSAADVFVLPSWAEGCSNSIVEAMACGLPIISSDLPFNYDILNSENSFLVNPNDITAIASAISKLKKDRNLSKQMGKCSLEVAKDLTIPKRASKIIEFIKSKIAN